jgi:sortase (surface protein transpeptidase)
MVAGATGLALSRAGGPGPAPVPAAVTAAVTAAPEIISPTGDTRAAVPVGLEIPAIGVRTSLVRLGRTAAGALQVPGSFTEAGWYDLGPRPGQDGPAVIAGHVDSMSGPAVFYRLGDLRAGMRVDVRRADGSVVAFVVTGVLMYRKAGFPADAVYGPVTGPQLRLITCGGTFDYARRGYQSNVVVYATEVS